jgi:phosphate transport system permease protein
MTRGPNSFAEKENPEARQSLAFRGRKLSERALALVTWTAAIATVCVLAYIIVFIFVKGAPYIKPSLFSFTYNSDNVSLMPALISTVMMTALSLVISVPLGVFAAVYLTEYAKRGNRAVTLIRMTMETLSGIPSIVYGLFGMLFFVTFLGWGFSVLAGTFTLSIMILPLIMRSSEEAIIAVPDTYREGSFGLGAGRLRTVFRIVLPSAAPGILAGVILAVGRIVGETAALIYTSGTVAQVPGNVYESARTLSVHMYALSSEGLHIGEGYATAVVLLLVVILINTCSAWIARRVGTNFGRNE